MLLKVFLGLLFLILAEALSGESSAVLHFCNLQNYTFFFLLNKNIFDQI